MTVELDTAIRAMLYAVPLSVPGEMGEQGRVQ